MSLWPPSGHIGSTFANWKSSEMERGATCSCIVDEYSHPEAANPWKNQDL
jgi:hypothetical protein